VETRKFKDVAKIPVNSRCLEQTRSLEMLTWPFSDYSDKSLVSDETFCIITSNSYIHVVHIDDILPQADRGHNDLAQKTMPAEGEFEMQTVKFKDTHPGYAMDVGVVSDPLTDHSFPDDVPLDKFFARPIKIFDVLWNVNGTVNTSFDPWSIFFNNPRVLNRISNYRLMRCKLHLKIMVNGTPFHYGRLMFTYQPLPNDDGYTVVRAGITEDAVAGSQRPHVLIDPTNSQGGDLILPFFWYENAIDLPAADFDKLGRVDTITLNPLKHALDKTSPVHILVYAWAEDMHLSIPTQVDVGGIVPQAEYTKGPVSRVATSVASVAQLFGKAPIIGTFAKATSLAASAAGQIASLYGYSNPPQLESMNVRPVVKSNFATSSGLDEVTKLTLDPKSETTIDTTLVDLTGEDEMVISSIAARESYLTTFAWGVTAGSENRLFSIVVDPAVRAIRNTEMHLPACAFSVMPFEYWRGSMKYRFQVVCSKYHKGRLAITWDPVSDVSGTTNFETNTNYTTIVDISDTTDFTIDVGWGQTTAYREHVPVFPTNSGTPVAQDVMFSTSALTYSSTTLPYGNGVLSVYVINELSVPDDTIDADISVNVFVSAGEDFQVAAPCSTYLNQMLTSSIEFPKDVRVPDPQAEIVSASDPEETQRTDSAPAISIKLDALGPMSKDVSLNDFYFGENIVSFRQLVKRYVTSEYLPFSLEAGQSGLPVNSPILVRSGREAMPAEPMFVVTTNGGTFDILSVAGNGLFYFAFFTPLRYLTLAFGGWRGTLRQTLITDLARGSQGFYRGGVTTLSWRTGVCANYINASPAQDFWNATDRGTYYGGMRDNEGMSGTTMTQSEINPMISAEVPFFTNYKFAPAKTLPRFAVDVTASYNDAIEIQPGKTYFEITRQAGIAADNTTNLPTIQRMVAAGEDFNLFFYLGPPILFAAKSLPVEP
jgi:hypothetical protein